MDTTTTGPAQCAPTRAQKDRKACIDCGDEAGPFTRVGFVSTRTGDGPLAWPVVACPAHKDNAR